MEKKLPLEEMSISDIYLKSQDIMTYMIPVYQRNYAWEEDQITALIKMCMTRGRRILRHRIILVPW